MVLWWEGSAQAIGRGGDSRREVSTLFNAHLALNTPLDLFANV